MKSFKKYLTPEEQIKELSLAEKAWQSAKQKIAENKELSAEEQEVIDKFLGIEPAYEPDDGPLTESQVEQIQEQVQYQLVTGPQGEQGPQGIAGEKGERGDQGEQGIPGIQGERGERGERGLAGLNGLRGEKGDQGQQGIQGERGEVGPQGEQGIPGRDGVDGQDGQKGDKGDQGEQGIPGVAGRDGVDGKDGKSGPKGERGEKGQNGKDGRDGKDGAQGEKGDKGDRGERGEKGDRGNKGEDGKTPDLKPFTEKFNKLSLDINKKVGRIASDMGALASGGGSGSYWLNDLGDTDYSSIVNATDQQVLTYSEADKKWIAADSQGGGGGTLDQWARNRANAAFVQANTPSYTANSGSLYANSAFIHANAAFEYANTITFTTDPSAGLYANAAFVQANTPSYTANSAASYANSAFLKANTPDHVANSASSYANSAFSVANSAFTSANGTIVWNTANAAFLQANTPDHVSNSASSYANSAFITANSASVYANSAFAAANAATATDATQNTNIASASSYANSAFLAANTPSYTANSAASYANSAFTKANTAITTSGGSITGQLNVAYTPATATGYALTLSTANTQGGIGYADFLKITNTSGGATNPNKSFRLTSGGGIEIVNSGYTATILGLSDTGDLSVSGKISVNGAQAVNGPAFSAYAAAILQTIPNNAQTKVLFQTEEYDTNGCYSSSRFTPNVAGYYQLNAEVRIDGTSGTGEMMIILYKNGSEYKRGTNQSGTQIASNFWAMQVSSVAYANGTTDYFEIYVQQGSGGDRTVTAVDNTAITWFNGCMLRGA